MITVLASELCMAHLGLKVTVRSPSMNVTGIIDYIWFHRAYSNKLPNYVTLKLKFEGGELDIQLTSSDTVTLHDTEVSD